MYYKNSTLLNCINRLSNFYFFKWKKNTVPVMALVADELKFVTRQEWIAMKPKETFPITQPVLRVKFSIENHMEPCYNKEDCLKAVKEVQNFYCDMGSEDIPYNFMVGDDGHVYEGRGWHHRPVCNVLRSHEKWDQTLDIGILAGHALGTPEAFASIRKAYNNAHRLVKYGVEQKIIADNYEFHGFQSEVLEEDEFKI